MYSLIILITFLSFNSLKCDSEWYSYQNKSSPTKWGILSAGKISHDFTAAVRSFPEGDHEIVAVAARELKSAKDFATLQKIPKAYGSYEELAKDPDVQVVYIGAINTVHLPAAKLMLEHGKHILVEKPLTLNVKQTKELFALAKAKKLFAMEALWSRFLPSYEFVLDQIKKGVIGDIYHVTASLGFKLADIERVTKRELGGGTLLDLGVYTINIVEQVFNGEMPEQIQSIGYLNKDGVDLAFSAGLKFKNGRTASISTHSQVSLPNEAQIVGTKGIIKLGSSFGSAEKVYINDILHEFKFPPTVLPMIFGGSSGLRYQANEVRRCLIAGKLESDRMSHNDSIIIATIEDQIRKQIGVKFDVD